MLPTNNTLIYSLRLRTIQFKTDQSAKSVISLLYQSEESILNGRPKTRATEWAACLIVDHNHNNSSGTFY